MKRFFIFFSLAAVLLTGFSQSRAHALSRTETYTSFALGFYYIYEEELELAAEQFEICISNEAEPSAALFATAAEVYHLMGDQDKAENYARSALKIDSNNITALRVMVMTHTTADQYEEALPFLKRLRAQVPEDLQVLYHLAEAYNRLQDDDELLKTYRQILRLVPEQVMVRLELAYLYTRQGALIRAEQEYKKVLAYDPGNQQAFFYLAYIYLSRGQTEEALQYFRQLDRSGMLNEAMLEDYAVSMFVEGLDPGPVLERIDDGENLSATLRGILLLRKGDLQGARELFQSAAEEEPYMLAPYVGMIQIAQARGDKVVEAENRYALANSYYASGQYEQALEQTLKVREAGPFLPEGSELQAENLYLLADIYAALGRADAAVREYEKYLANAENDGEVHFKLGLQYDSLGRYREAIQQFRLAAEQFPENHELYYYIGIEYRLLEDHEQAVDAFHQAVELDPDNAQYLFQLGVSYERMGDIASAVRYLEESVQLDDSDPSSLNYLGYLLADVGIRLDEAEEYIRKALEYEPRNGAYLDSMGWLYYRKSQFERAREYLEEAVRYMDDAETENYLILDHLGDVYLELDMPEKAIESWENALRMMQVGEIEQKIHEVRKELQ